MESSEGMDSGLEQSMDGIDDPGNGLPRAEKLVLTFGGASTEEARKTIDAQLGLVADVMKTLFSARQGAGNFGVALDSMEAEGQKLAAQMVDVGGVSPNALPMWIPGVDFVGEGVYTDMLAIAKSNQIDFLMHFDIIVKENRLGTPTYTTRCKLLMVGTGETIGISKAIDKYDVAGKKIGIRESVEELLVNLFEIMDKKVTVEPMPALQPQQAIARIDSLLGSANAGSLRNLAEIMMFRSRDLITPELLDKAFLYAGGEGALQMLHDEESLRYTKVNEYVDRELSASDSK